MQNKHVYIYVHEIIKIDAQKEWDGQGDTASFLFPFYFICCRSKAFRYYKQFLYVFQITRLQRRIGMAHIIYGPMESCRL